jgi:hypothetical protein
LDDRFSELIILCEKQFSIRDVVINMDTSDNESVLDFKSIISENAVELKFVLIKK